MLLLIFIHHVVDASWSGGDPAPMGARPCRLTWLFVLFLPLLVLAWMKLDMSGHGWI